MTTFLSGEALEREVHQRLVALDVEHIWLNEDGESYEPYDFRVFGVALDAKGSTDYYGTAFIDAASAMRQWNVERSTSFWYVLNDMKVVSLREVSDSPDTRYLEYPRPGVVITGTRSLEDWIKEMTTCAQ